MGLFSIILCAISLAMDAFAVSICKGIAIRNVKIKHQCIVGLWFGGFQALMPLIGYFVSIWFKGSLIDISHTIAFVLLAMIGVNMIKDAKEKDHCEVCDDSLSVKHMFPYAIATSIDALAVGVTFALLEVDILMAVVLIGLITFIFSFVGVKIGSLFGDKFKDKAQIFGGIVLILLAIKIMLENLF